MLASHSSPIAAIATAPGRGAVGIVRVSGPALSALAHTLCGRTLTPRLAHYLPFLDDAGQAIDHGLALYFPAPHSYTGEDVLELQAHGGPVVLQMLLARCLQAGRDIGLRVAEPGEFTQRAFLNDKLDLAQAEAVADLIDASTETAARSASRSLSGGFSAEIHRLRDALVRLRLLVEATLDFPEEEIDFLQKADAQGQLLTLQAAVARVLDLTQQGALLREGMTVVLAGQPNVGKSSLLNALAGAERAIVTAVAGTTRDKVTETLQIQGVPVHVVDTAGLRDSQDEVERIGISRSWQAIHDADAVLFLHDLSRMHQVDYQRDDAVIMDRLPESARREGRLIHVLNKSDLVNPAQTRQATEGLSESGPASTVVLSAQTGDGLQALREQLLTMAGWHSVPEGLFIARKRHVLALIQTQNHLYSAQQQLALAENAALDLVAEELRLAQQQLSVITGVFTADDLLGEIFSRFCIGK
ncbi:MAG: tRNA uridine-5-carboxymethylaminomethyl(34) synthesis GTPase MnmE [Rhizobacter sp.]